MPRVRPGLPLRRARACDVLPELPKAQSPPSDPTRESGLGTPPGQALPLLALSHPCPDPAQFFPVAPPGVPAATRYLCPTLSFRPHSGAPPNPDWWVLSPHPGGWAVWVLLRSPHLCGALGTGPSEVVWGLGPGRALCPHCGPDSLCEASPRGPCPAMSVRGLGTCVSG